MIHQVADENGILKHIILSIMGANEDGSQHDSTVINFPQGPFRIDSHGQLVSINNAGGGGGVGASNEAMPLTSLPPQVYFANYDGCPPIAYDTAAAAAADPAAVEPPLVGAYTAADQPTVMGAPPLPAGATSGDPSYHSLQAPQTTSELGSPQYKSQMLAAGNYPSQPTAYPQPQASCEHNHHHHHHHVPVGATMASVVSSNINKQSAQQQQQQQLLVNNQALPQSPAAYNVQTGGCYPPPEDQYHALVMPANQTTRYGRHHESQALLAKDKSGRYQGTNVKAINHNNNHHHHHHHNQHLGINNVPSRASVSPQRLARVKNNNLAPQQQNHTNQHNLHHHHHSQWNGVGRNNYQAPDYEKPPPSPSNASSINSNSSSNRQQTTKSYAYHAHQQPVIPSAAHQIHPLGNKQQQQHINNPLVFNQAQAPHYHTPNGQVVGKGPKSQQANKVAGSAKRPKSANNSNHGQDNLVMVDVSSTDTMRNSDAKYLTTLVSPSEAPCPINDTDDQLFVLTAPPEQHQAGDQGAQVSRSSRGKQKKCQNQSQQGNNKAAASIDRQSVDSNRQGSHQHNNSSTKLLARAGSLVNKQHQASHADNRLDSGGVDKVVSIASDSSVGGKVTNNSSDGKQANKQQSNEKQQGKQSKKNRPLDKLQSSLVGNKQSGCGEPSKRSEHLGKIAKVDGDEELNLSPLSSSSATCGNLNGNNNNNDKQAQQHQQEQSSSNNKTNGSNGRELTSTSSVGARAANNNEANLVCSEIANKRSSFSGRQNSIELQPLPSSLSSGDLDQNLGKTEFPAVTAIKQRRGSDGKQSIKIVDSSSPSSPARRHQPKKASLVHDATSDHAVQLLPEITINDQQVAVGDDEILLVSTSCESQPASEKDAQTKGVVRAPPVTVTMRTSLSENNIKSLHDKQLSLLSAKSTQTTPTLTAAGSSSSAKSASSLSGSHSSSSVSNQEHHAGKKKTSGDKRKNGVKSCTTSAVSSANLGKKGLVKHVRNSMDPALLDTNAISNHHNISNSPLISSSSSSSGPGYRNNNNSSSHSSNSNHSSGGSGSTKTISQPIKYSFKQCRNKFVSILGRLVQNSLSTYSDAKFAGLLLVMFTIFAMLLAIFIHIYISE